MALVKPIGPQHGWHQFLGGMPQPSPTQSRWSSSQIVTPSHSNSVSPPFDFTEIDNISAKRRKFVNVVDPHIKKEWLFHHLDGKILNDQRRGCTTGPSFTCHWSWCFPMPGREVPCLSRGWEKLSHWSVGRSSRLTALFWRLHLGRLTPVPQSLPQRCKNDLSWLEVRDKGLFVKKVSYKQIDDPTDVGSWTPWDDVRHCETSSLSWFPRSMFLEGKHRSVFVYIYICLFITLYIYSKKVCVQCSVFWSCRHKCFYGLPDQLDKETHRTSHLLQQYSNCSRNSTSLLQVSCHSVCQLIYSQRKDLQDVLNRSTANQSSWR